MPLEKCVSNERLHNKNVCVPLKRDGHKSLIKFRGHIKSFTDIKTLICSGKA